MQAVSITPYADADFDSVTAIWLDSANSIGIPMPVTLAELRDRWPRELAAGWDVHVARKDGVPVAFLAMTPGKVNQLFVRPECQGQGIGKRLLDFAKVEMPDGFSLTTAVIGRAGKFYAREGLMPGETSLHPFGHELIRYDWRP